MGSKQGPPNIGRRVFLPSANYIRYSLKGEFVCGEKGKKEGTAAANKQGADADEAAFVPSSAGVGDVEAEAEEPIPIDTMPPRADTEGKKDRRVCVPCTSPPVRPPLNSLPSVPLLPPSLPSIAH